MCTNDPTNPVGVNTISKLVLAETIPKFSGQDGTIMPRAWLAALETSFATDLVSTDADKIKKARAAVNYTAGDAKNVFLSYEFQNWQVLKDTLFYYILKNVKKLQLVIMKNSWVFS